MFNYFIIDADGSINMFITCLVQVFLGVFISHKDTKKSIPSILSKLLVETYRWMLTTIPISYTNA